MSPTSLPVRRTLVVPPPGVAGLLSSLSVFDSLSATGRLVVALAETEPASLVYATLLHLRMRDRPPEDVAEPLCLHRDAGLDYQRLQDMGFDEAVLLSPSLADARRVTAAGIPRRWGYAPGPWFPKPPPLGGWFRSWLLRPAVSRPDEPPPWVGDDAEALLDAMDVPWQRRHRLFASESFVRVGAERLDRAKVAAGRQPIVAVYVGKGDADWSRRKGTGNVWPEVRWLELLKQLRTRRPAWRFVFVSGAEELWRCVKLHEKTGKIHPVLGPDLDLLGIAAVLGHCDLVIGRGDTWPVQLAAAVGARVCALFDGGAQRLVPPCSEGHEAHLVSTTPLSRLAVDDVLALLLES